MKEIKTLLNNKILESIPRVLSLLDKNPISPTYGSFDRKYWHYKLIDFPCGMVQELIVSLAYVYLNNFDGNIYNNSSRIKEYILGVMKFHKISMHKDGSLDDYFPYERAFGATAYALAGLTETALIMKNIDSDIIESFRVSAKFLAEYREAGKLSNHLAIGSLALFNLYILTKEEYWKIEAEKILEELFQKQTSEGWFPEYEGCDLGYQTVTIEFLARYYQKNPSDKLFEILKKTIIFVRKFIHPDGSLGGEYGSRNTYNFYPGGFAILSHAIPEAAEVLYAFQKGFENGTLNDLSDDGVIGHMFSTYITLLNQEKLVVNSFENIYAEKPIVTYFDKSKFFIGSINDLKIFGTLTKCGIYKIFKKDKLIWSDTGYAGLLENGKRFCQNKPNISDGTVNNNKIEIIGYLQKFNVNILSNFQVVVLRVFAICFGWIRQYSNLIRFLMQKILIYKKSKLDIEFSRIINIDENYIEISDTIKNKANSKIVKLYRTTDLVNTHVITSNSFQIANLLNWEEEKIDINKNEFKFVKIFE